MRTLYVAAALAWVIAFPATAAPLKLDESPASDEQWGYRPAESAVSETSPPSFSWRPQKTIVAWEIEVRSRDDQDWLYHAKSIEFNVHCPDRIFPPGAYRWRYRGIDKDDVATDWSLERGFTIAEDAVPLPLPPRTELLSRIPETHPRLFVRPEEMPRLREQARGPLKDRYAELVARCEKLLANPPPTAEPKKYPDDMERGSPEWKQLWWGNRTYTIHAPRQRGHTRFHPFARRQRGVWPVSKTRAARIAPSGIPRGQPATDTTTKPACRMRTTFHAPTPSCMTC